MFYIREEGEVIRHGFNFYPLRSASVGCQMLFGPLRVEARWSRRTKRFQFGAWLRTYAKPTKNEIIYIPGYSEFLTQCARKRFGNRPWEGVEPEDKFKDQADG